MRFLGFVALMACEGENKLASIDEKNNNDGVQIEVSPRSLDFGSLTAEDDPSIREFTIASLGADELVVDAIEVIGTQGASFTILSPETNFTIASGETRNIEVAFSPVDANQIFAEILVASNAGNEPELTVDLVAEGIIGALAISPDPYNFGQHNLGCAQENEFTISNVGSDDVTISEIAQVGDDFTIVDILSSDENGQPVSVLDLLSSDGDTDQSNEDTGQSDEDTGLSDEDSAQPGELVLSPAEEITVKLSFLPMVEAQVSSEIQVTSDELMGTRIARQTGSGDISNQITQEWEFDADPPSDIMFSVDASCSMSDNTQQLASNFSTFINQLSNYTSDWQVLVTGGDTGCNAGGILTPQTPNYAGVFQNAVKCKDDIFSSFFAQCAVMGDTYTEALLTEARNAIEQTDPGECNAGFMRSNAMLHIVLVSDEPEQSADISGETWNMLADQIIAKRGTDGLVRISSIVGDVPNGCNSGGFFSSDAYPGTGYVDASAYTDGVFLSICDNWASANNLELLAETSVLLEAYPLDNQAIEETIQVTVNGFSVNPDYWHYDSSTQAVIFDSNPPADGATVTITYVPIGLCE